MFRHSAPSGLKPSPLLPCLKVWLKELASFKSTLQCRKSGMLSKANLFILKVISCSGVMSGSSSVAKVLLVCCWAKKDCEIFSQGSECNLWRLCILLNRLFTRGTWWDGEVGWELVILWSSLKENLCSVGLVERVPCGDVLRRISDGEAQGLFLHCSTIASGGIGRYCFAICLPHASLSGVMMMISFPLALQASIKILRVSSSLALMAYIRAEEPVGSSRHGSAPLLKSSATTSGPACSKQACIRAVFPLLSWMFGSAPLSSRYPTIFVFETLWWSICLLMQATIKGVSPHSLLSLI